MLTTLMECRTFLHLEWILASVAVCMVVIRDVSLQPLARMEIASMVLVELRSQMEAVEGVVVAAVVGIRRLVEGLMVHAVVMLGADAEVQATAVEVEVEMAVDVVEAVVADAAEAKSIRPLTREMV